MKMKTRKIKTREKIKSREKNHFDFFSAINSIHIPKLGLELLSVPPLNPLLAPFYHGIKNVVKVWFTDFYLFFSFFSEGSETAFSAPSIAATDFFISYPFVATCSPCVTFSSRE